MVNKNVVILNYIYRWKPHQPSSMDQTLREYDEIIATCKALFLKKHQDYGSSWRILRLPSITDQLYIKAKRIRSIEEKGVQQVHDPIDGEFMGLINYSIIALIQLELGEDDPIELSRDQVEKLYDENVAIVRTLMMQKNHDYGEVWREMRVSSMTDLILTKLLRIKQIEDNKGSTLVSEGAGPNYMDIINYAIFALIKLDETTTSGITN